MIIFEFQWSGCIRGTQLGIKVVVCEGVAHNYSGQL